MDKFRCWLFFARQLVLGLVSEATEVMCILCAHAIVIVFCFFSFVYFPVMGNALNK